jgi:hypothetical protein
MKPTMPDHHEAVQAHADEDEQSQTVYIGDQMALVQRL